MSEPRMSQLYQFDRICPKCGKEYGDHRYRGEDAEPACPKAHAMTDLVKLSEQLRINACRLSHETEDEAKQRRIKVELEAASALESLTAENAALSRQNLKLGDLHNEAEKHVSELMQELSGVSGSIGSVRFMDPPDGGDVTLAEQVNRMRVALEEAEARNATLLQQRNEAFERAAEVADAFADRSLHHYHAVKIAAAIRNLSKES